MYAVNKLVQDAYESIGMAMVGDDTDGTMSKIGERELNRAITTLNGQGFLALSQKWADVGRSREIRFHLLEEDESAGNHEVNMKPPQKIEAVARKIGNRFIQLMPTNHMQMAAKNPSSTATGWTWDLDIEDGPTQPREVGILTLDGDPRNDVRVWYNGQIPHYSLDDIIYLPDLYNELLLSATAYNLACFHELSQEKKDDSLAAFNTAKSLIKPANAQMRMGQAGFVCTSWADNYANGLAGSGF